VGDYLLVQMKMRNVHILLKLDVAATVTVYTEV